MKPIVVTEQATMPIVDLMAEVYPDIPVHGPVVGHTTLLTIDKARAVLGYNPTHRWRNYVTP